MPKGKEVQDILIIDSSRAYGGVISNIFKE